MPVGTGEKRFTIYALVAVVPDGKLARAGARAGDIPVEYHGGLWAFHGALEQARAGEEGRFDVVAQADWPDWDKRRKLVLPPEVAHR